MAYPCGDAGGMLSTEALTVGSLLHYLSSGNAHVVAKIALAVGEPKEDVEAMVGHHTVGGSFYGTATTDMHATSVEIQHLMKTSILGGSGPKIGRTAMLEAHQTRQTAWRENSALNLAKHQSAWSQVEL